MNDKELKAIARQQWVESMIGDSTEFSGVNLADMNKTMMDITTSLDELEHTDSIIYKNALVQSARDLKDMARQFATRANNIGREVSRKVKEDGFVRKYRGDLPPKDS